MFKKVTKKLVLGLLMFAMLITTVVFMPADAQAATKKAKKATVYEYYTYADNYFLSGQLGDLKKWPVQLKVSDIIVNRNKKAKYTFYAANKKKMTISKTGKITAVKNCKDGEVLKVVVKETYKKKTRKVGVMKFTVIMPKIMQKKVTWYVGQQYDLSCEEWSRKVYYPEIPAYIPGRWGCVWQDEPLTDADAAEGVKRFDKESSDGGDGDAQLVKWNDDTERFEALKEGTAYFAVYAYNYSTKKYYAIGKFQVNIVKCTKADSVSLDIDYDYDYSDTPYVVVGKDATLYCNVEPYYFHPDALSVTSSDPSVATVSYDEKEGTYYVHGVKSGTVTITADANGLKKTIQCKVLTQEEEDKLKCELPE